jgi:hypothetical protein
MQLSYANTHLTPEDKLDAIRQIDFAGTWESLDDWRYCTVCKKLFSGRQIEVLGGTRPSGPLRLHCPTAECDSTPADWRLSYSSQQPADSEFSFIFEEDVVQPVPALYCDNGR